MRQRLGQPVARHTMLNEICTLFSWNPLKNNVFYPS